MERGEPEVRRGGEGEGSDWPVRVGCTAGRGRGEVFSGRGEGEEDQSVIRRGML